jgi:hypothetical protein
VRAKDIAIITERDVLRALSEQGAAALTRPVAQFANKPLIAVPAAAFVYLALARMSRLKLRHLGVEDENGEICGVVTSRDLLRLRAQEASMLGDALDLADDVPTLAAAWARLPRAVRPRRRRCECTRCRGGNLARARRAHPPRRCTRRTADESGRLRRASLRLCAVHARFRWPR